MRRNGLLLGWLPALLALAGCAAPGSDELRTLVALDGERGRGAASSPYERGKEHFDYGRFGLAIEAFHLALLTEGESIATLNGLGASYDRLERFDLAMRYYDRALALDPESPLTLNNIGYSHLLQRNLHEAQRYLQSAQNRDPEDQTISANLGVARSLVSRAQPARPLEADARLKARPQQRPAETAWVQRMSGNVQSLVTAPQAAFLVSATRAEVSPRLVGDDQSSGANVVSISLQNDTAPVGFTAARPQPVAELGGLKIEVSNGAGRRHMAARMARRLRSLGVQVAGLTNAETFSNKRSVIYYRDGFKAAATQLARLFPVAVPIKPLTVEGWSDLRLTLGGDLLEYDRMLMRNAANDEEIRT